MIKELFDYIDCRQDGVIDIHEWMQTFKKIKVNINIILIIIV